MKILVANKSGLEQALTLLRAGGTVAHATETCYGLACDMTNAEAVQRLFAIKQRPMHQPVSALFASIETAKAYVQWNARAEELAQKSLPGPLTLILLLAPTAPTSVFPTPDSQSLGTSLGIRISSHPLATQLAQEFGGPISTTSANISGKPNPYSAEDIVGQFQNQELQPDIVLDSGQLEQNPPSKVVDLTEDGEHIVRI